MSVLTKKNASAPDETRPFVDGKGRMEIVVLDGDAVGRGTFEPGWRWSSHVKPLAGTDSCQAFHVGYVEAGRMAIRMDDGGETEVGPGDFMVCPPGHDAWVVGDEVCVLIDWRGVAQYAKGEDLSRRR